MQRYSINESINYNFIILANKKTKNSYIYIYNIQENFFLWWKVQKDMLYVHQNTKSLYLYCKRGTAFSIKLAKYFFENILYKKYFTFFFKMYFKGKGFKMKKRKNIVRYGFYFSHINIFKIQTFKFKKIGKQKYIIIGNDYHRLKNTALKFVKVRFINKFNKRGLRLSKQKINKRPGKKNAYTKKTF